MMRFVSTPSAKRWLIASLLLVVMQSGLAVNYEKAIPPQTVIATIPHWMQQKTVYEKDPHVAAKLITQLLETAAKNGDQRALGRARALLDPWWNDKAPPSEILLQRARYQQRTHAFSAAEGDFQLLVNNHVIHESLRIQAWLGLANTQILLGKNQRAFRACKQIPGTRYLLESLSCQARVLSVSGQLERAIKTYRAVLTQRGVSNEQFQWLQNALGEVYWVANKPAKAQAMLSAAAANSGQAHLIKTYADFLIEQRQPGEILRLIPSATRDAALLLRRVIAEKILQQPDYRKTLARLNSLKDQARVFGRKTHLADEALFARYIEENPDRALALARQNLNAQKDVADRFLVQRMSRESHAQSKADQS